MKLKKLCISLAYRNGNYIHHDKYVEEWLGKEVKINCGGKVII